MNGLQTANPVAAQIVFWVAVILLVAILVHFGFIAARIYRATVRPPVGATALAGGPLLDAAGHIARAEALARTGRYTEALAHRFIALLLELDRRDAVKFHVSKTPAEYVGDARLDAAGRESFAGLVAVLYRHVFAAVPCDPVQYDDFGMQAQSLLQHVASR
ncbi:MAG TPA: hypothetical protein VMH88_14505 [Gemmatimonadales bacterium]|nr:hypothetical protein [Gemmatimonadales bacterium]